MKRFGVRSFVAASMFLILSSIVFYYLHHNREAFIVPGILCFIYLFFRFKIIGVSKNTIKLFTFKNIFSSTGEINIGDIERVDIKDYIQAPTTTICIYLENGQSVSFSMFMIGQDRKSFENYLTHNGIQVQYS